MGSKIPESRVAAISRYEQNAPDAEQAWFLMTDHLSRLEIPSRAFVFAGQFLGIREMDDRV